MLAHRDARDWYVFEAASWALAERRMPAERRRELWLEPLPAVELAGRLRDLPLFASLSVDELFRVAGAGRQVRHETGHACSCRKAVSPRASTCCSTARSPPRAATGASRRLDPPTAIGFAEALSGTAMRETVRTIDATVTLVLSVEELRTLLAENSDFVTGLFATLAGPGEGPDGILHHTPAAGEFEALRRGGTRSGRESAGPAARPGLLASHGRRNAVPRGGRSDRADGPGGVRCSWSPRHRPCGFCCRAKCISRAVPARRPSSPRAAMSSDRSAPWPGRAWDDRARLFGADMALKLDRDDLFGLTSERPELLRQLFAGLFRNQAFVA